MKGNKKKTVLVVEDDASLQKIISMKLREAGYAASNAAHGEEALEMLQSGNSLPDLVWLDIYLPKIDGLELLEHVRKNKKMKSLRVIVVSVSGSNVKIQRAKKLGVVDYFVKSNYKIDELVNRVNKILK